MSVGLRRRVIVDLSVVGHSDFFRGAIERARCPKIGAHENEQRRSARTATMEYSRQVQFDRQLLEVYLVGLQSEVEAKL